MWFVASTFVSAALLFCVQPMAAKMILPWFGGSAAVWNVAVFFFQVLLLAGYAYSAWLVRRVDRRWQLAIHAALILLPLAFLPPVFSSDWVPDAKTWPIPAILRALCVMVGLPFFVLSSNSSLQQHFFASASARPPYFLYAASNAGSLLGLLAYPFAIEPWMGLRAQANAWSFGYGAFAMLALITTWRGLRSGGGVPVASVPRDAPLEAGSRPGTPLGWTVRAAVASILLLAVTLRITTDIAPMPLFWVLPLAVYLLTFIIAFSAQVRVPRVALEIATAVLISVALAFPKDTYGVPTWVTISLPMAILFCGAWLCHSDLWRQRPAPLRLTEFYLWIAVGGALGGAFCNFVAPLVFDAVGEYPIGLFLVSVVIALGRRQRADRTDWASPLTYARLGLPIAVLCLWAFYPLDRTDSVLFKSIPLLTLLSGLLAWRLIGQFQAATFAAALVFAINARMDGIVSYRHRSYYGTMRIHEFGDRRELIHGTTMHGGQIRGNPWPILYYHPDTPMGSAVLQAAPDARIGVVGLGTGSIAGLMSPKQTVTYFEIDPDVEHVARRFFRYLGSAKGEVEIILGDARLQMVRAPIFDLLVLDAFSSDAVPVHLLTLEAFRLYFEHLVHDGVLLVHTSNRSLDLHRVLRGAARTLGVSAALFAYEPTDDEHRRGAESSDAVALSRSKVAVLQLGAKWQPLGDGPEVTWTDDRSSLLGVMK